jgi:hypothetical protein
MKEKMIPWYPLNSLSTKFYKQEKNFFDARPPIPPRKFGHVIQGPVFYRLPIDVEVFKQRISLAREKRVQRSRELR